MSRRTPTHVHVNRWIRKTTPACMRSLDLAEYRTISAGIQESLQIGSCRQQVRDAFDDSTVLSGQIPRQQPENAFKLKEIRLHSSERILRRQSFVGLKSAVEVVEVNNTCAERASEKRAH
jgi:hypothetical protein